MPTTAVRRLTVALVAALAVVAPVAWPTAGHAADPTGASTTTTAPTAPATTTPAANGDGDNQVLREDYDRVLAGEADALHRLADTVQRRQATQLQLLSLELQIQDTTSKLGLASAALDRAEQARAQAEADLGAAEQRVASSKSDLKRQVLTSYVTGGDGTDAAGGLDKVLGSGDDREGQTQTYASAVVRRQRKVITEYNDARTERDRQARLADDADARARQSRDDMAAFKSALERNKLDQLAVEQNLQVEQLAEQLQFDQLEKSKAEIVSKVVGLARDADGITNLVNTAQAGEPPFTFPLVPLVDPTPGAAYTQSFGPQGAPVLGQQGFHPGIDLAGPAGVQVHAAGDGTVIWAGPLGGYGNAVIIDHGTHLATLYGHNQQVLVTVGQKVKQNEVISLRGSTGFSTGPHVHFETRVNGVPIDPLLFVHLL